MTRLKTTFSVLFLFGSVSLSIPASATVTIQKIGKNSIVVKSDGEPLSVGQLVTATSELLDTCEMKITKTKGQQGLVDSSNCSFAADLKSGEELSIGSSPNRGTAAVSARRMGAGKVGGVAGYNLTSTFSGAGSGYTLEDTASGALVFGGRYLHPITEQISVLGGFNYELDRAYSSTKLNGLSASTTGTYSLMWLEGSGTYSFNQNIYGLGGLNLSLPSINGRGTTSATSALGIQVGGGYNVNKNISAEVLFLAINNTAKAGTVALDYYHLWGILFRGVYYLDF